MKWLSSLVLFKFVAGFQFKTGRILPHTNGDLDLSDLNLAGPYKPGEAILACERHQFCAGFTYRGPIRYRLFIPALKENVAFISHSLTISLSLSM